MRDLFTRLVEQTLGHVKGVEPVIASRFAPGRASFQWPEVKTPEDGIRRFEGREGPAVFPKPFFPLPGEVERISSSMARSPTDLQAREEGEETPALVPDQSVHSDKKKEGNGRISSDKPPDIPENPRIDRPQPDIQSNWVQPPLTGFNPRNHEQSRQRELSAKGRKAPDHPFLSHSSDIETVGHLSEFYVPRPTVRVTIGRVEVKAMRPPLQPERPKPSRPGPALPLEAYLKQRNEGKR
jgi:hypothetical protein